MTPGHKTADLASSQDDFVPKKPSRTGSWDRAVVFDPKNNSVDIRKKRDVELHGTNDYKVIKLSKQRKDVSLFVEPDKGTILKTEQERKSDDVFLARLNLDHLGFRNRARLRLGYLNTLYVFTDLG